ncbi:hypothetical protein J3458_018879 [Metarhizium acridum]|uniref:uncharacterized protein n=1 Tax=Metarhizium acridum TaxID=92637 RepID=UPI001C6BAD2C|nr:hypothetical protein J3458_018879 [Metarhizium acridum]
MHLAVLAGIRQGILREQDIDAAGTIELTDARLVFMHPHEQPVSPTCIQTKNGNKDRGRMIWQRILPPPCRAILASYIYAHNAMPRLHRMPWVKDEEALL